MVTVNESKSLISSRYERLKLTHYPASAQSFEALAQPYEHPQRPYAGDAASISLTLMGKSTGSFRAADRSAAM